MIQTLPWLIALLAAAAVAIALFLVLRVLIESSTRVAALGRVDGAPEDILPSWVRLPVALFAPAADWLGPRVPIVIRGSVQERLKRAGLDEALTPPQFLLLGLSLMWLLGGLAATTRVSLVLTTAAFLVGGAAP